MPSPNISPVFDNASILQLVLEKIDTLQTLCNIARTCRLGNKLLKTKPCDEQWMHAARKICGDEYWKDATLPGQPHANDKRYTAMLRICPWLSAPKEITPRFIHRINDSEDRVARVFYIQQNRTILCSGLELGIHNEQFGGDEGEISEETYHAIITNPRPFGKQFEIEITSRPGTRDMSLEEMRLLEEIKLLSMPVEYTDGGELSRATIIHNGAVAVQLEGGDVKGSYFTRLLIFARKPALRVIHCIKKPYDVLVDNSFSFGLGEMWVSGTRHMDDVSGLFYFGPRNDKKTQKTEHFAPPERERSRATNSARIVFGYF